MQDDRELVEALRRALEPAPHEPSPERVAALQRQVRRRRLQRPLRRAAVAAAAALIALMGTTLVVRADGRHDQRFAEAVAIANTCAAIEQVRVAIAAGNPAADPAFRGRAGVAATPARARREGRGRCGRERRARRGPPRPCAAAVVDIHRSDDHDVDDILDDHDVDDHDVDDIDDDDIDDDDHDPRDGDHGARAVAPVVRREKASFGRASRRRATARPTGVTFGGVVLQED